MNTINKNLIVILGPTASGKTSLSLRLATSLKTEIISCDSRQFYKELLIGSCPPKKTELQKINHHFIQNMSIEKDYNVGDFERDAIKKINELFQKYDKLIMVGGSGLYADAVCSGLDEIPKSSQKIRESIQKEYTEKGLKWLQDAVKKIDYKFYLECDKKNPVRLMRALEVYKSTGKKFSFFRKKTKIKRSFTITKIGLKWDRKILYQRINLRVDSMMKDGLLNEVMSLEKFKKNNALQTIGYNELFDYLDRKINLDEAVEKIKINSRRFAKRQMTWLKKDSKIKWFSNKEKYEVIEDFILQH